MASVKFIDPGRKEGRKEGKVLKNIRVRLEWTG